MPDDEKAFVESRLEGISVEAIARVFQRHPLESIAVCRDAMDWIRKRTSGQGVDPESTISPPTILGRRVVIIDDWRNCQFLEGSMKLNPAERRAGRNETVDKVVQDTDAIPGLKAWEVIHPRLDAPKRPTKIEVLPNATETIEPPEHRIRVNTGRIHTYADLLQARSSELLNKSKQFRSIAENRNIMLDNASVQTFIDMMKEDL